MWMWWIRYHEGGNGGRNGRLIAGHFGGPLFGRSLWGGLRVLGNVLQLEDEVFHALEGVKLFEEALLGGGILDKGEGEHINDGFRGDLFFDQFPHGIGDSEVGQIADGEEFADQLSAQRALVRRQFGDVDFFEHGFAEALGREMFLANAGTRDALQEQIVFAVIHFFVRDDFADADHGMNIGGGVIVFLPTRLEKCHCHEGLIGKCCGHEVFVAVLKQMKRLNDARE